MKIFYILTFICLIVNINFAQIKYQNADGPKRDQRYVSIPATANKSKNYAATIKAGANETWDFTNFKFDTNSQVHVNVYSMSGVPYSNLYPRATISVGDQPKKDSNWTIMERSSSGLYLLGYIDQDGPLVFTNGLLQNPYPMIYPGTYADKDTIKFILDMDTAIIYFTLNGEVDGWGTIKLPEGDRPCLRTKSTIKQETYFSGVKLDENNNTKYEWWMNGNGFPVAEYSISSSSGSSDTTVNYNPKMIGVATKDYTFGEINIAPNPAHDFVIAELKDIVYNTADIKLFDISGMEVKHEVFKQGTAIKLNVKGLSNGIYLLQCITDETNTFIHKLIIE